VSVLLIGASHRTAPLAVRERLVFPEAELGPSLGRLCAGGSVTEGMILSTCNRTELLVHAGGGTEPAVSRVKEFLARERRFEPEELDRILYVKTGSEAVRHLFRLGAGLDSMILGEPQILGQVKEAYAAAVAAGRLGVRLQPLLQRAFSVAKRVRTDTDIGRNPVSVSYAAVDLAHKIFGDLTDRSVLLLGAGETAELAARHLASQGIRKILVANRTFRRAERLAAAFGGEAVPFDQFREHLARVDILISSTSAPHPILGRDDAARVLRARRNRPLFLIDLAVPRDIDPSVNQLDNIYLYDVDDLQQVADAGLQERRLAAEKAERLIEAEVAAYEQWARAQEVAPTIVALRDKLHRLREAEVGRFQGRLRDLPPEQRRAVEEMAASLINKVLHGPISRLKHAAASRNGDDRIAIVRELFDLEPAAGGTTGERGAAIDEEAAAVPGTDEASG
jgi:glutamyl-tRNA reductase